MVCGCGCSNYPDYPLRSTNYPRVDQVTSALSKAVLLRMVPGSAGLCSSVIGAGGCDGRGGGGSEHIGPEANIVNQLIIMMKYGKWLVELVAISEDLTYPIS
ncbi:hypothetical protein J6590_095939 [Homalodisca vitripennis]|nr:hypothetical protein J6590_095939 [Homalodisca vitripennis]